MKLVLQFSYSLKTIKIFVVITSNEEHEKLMVQYPGVTGCIIKPSNFNEKPSADTLGLKEELISRLAQGFLDWTLFNGKMSPYFD